MLITPFVVPPVLLGFPTVYDLVEDFGGDWDEWLHFYAVEAPTGAYTLNVPAGSYDASSVATGNQSATIQGAGMGQTFITIGTLSSQGSIPDGGQGTAPRINSVSAGSTTVTLQTLADATRFVEGWWIQIIGWSMQNFGYPPNNQFFDWVKLVDANTSTGVLTLDRPLTNDYSEDWPTYSVGGDPPNFDADTGGAATAVLVKNRNTNFIYNTEFMAQHPERQLWDQRLVIRDLTVANTADPDPEQAWFGEGRSILWERCEFAGFSGTASTATDWIFSDCLFSGESIETDKSVAELAFYNCEWDGPFGVTFQSSSIAHLTMDGCTNLGLNIGGRAFTITDCTFNAIRIGPGSYGACESGSIANCSATSVTDCSNRFVALSALGESIVAGVITIPKADVSGTDAINDLTPGTACFLGYSSGALKCFNILSVEQVGSDLVYTTDLPASLPETAIATNFTPHGCQRITISGCTGALEPYNGTTDEPLFTRSTQTVTGDDAARPTAMVYGTIVSITINVSQAYTGVQGTVKMNPLSTFGPSILYPGAHGVVGTQYQANINLKIAGTRVIMPGSTTGTQSGDSIPALSAGDNWIIGDGFGGNKPHINNGSIGTTLDISGESAGVRPIVTVTVICDQGI